MSSGAANSPSNPTRLNSDPEAEITAVSHQGDRPGTNVQHVEIEKTSEMTGRSINEETDESPQPAQKITGKRLHILSTAFTIATFMVAIDRTILATAIPRITREFKSLDQFGWYGSAYLLAQMSVQPTFGRVYVYFEAKSTYMLSLVIFEAGSVICATAPNSAVLILGRSVAGAGSAGMLTGSLAIWGQVVPLRQRPKGMAFITAMWALAGLLGPTLGGVFTDAPRLTWRFCFWINLPFGAICAMIVLYILEPKSGRHRDLPLMEKLIRLDPLGAVLLASSLALLFLALQWGGTQLPWSSPQVWGCLIGSGILTILFVALQAVRKEKATIPLRILGQRTVAISCAFSTLYAIAQVTHSYFLPIYFQSIKGTSAAISGVYVLPFTLVSTIFTIAVGFNMTAYGYYVPFMWIGSLVYIPGCVLYYLLRANSGPGLWVSCQVLTGIGFGIAIQISFIAVQVVTSSEDMPTACAWEVFFKSLGGAVGISIAQAIFSEVLGGQLRRITGLDASAVVEAGISNVSAAKGLIPAANLGQAREAYNVAVTRVFALPLAVTALAAVLSWGMERRRIEDEVEDTPPAEVDNVPRK